MPMRFTHLFAIAGLMVGLASSVASAQTPSSTPINSAAVIAPATNKTANVVSGTIQGIGKSATDMIQNNIIVQSLNKLLGVTPTMKTQPGFSPLPLPSNYQSTGYKNSFVPSAPVMSRFGQSPTGIFPK
ncbi:MAG: hypothetical protein U0798_05560 [Gemmataceae bacterium]